MSASNAFETALLTLIFNNTNLANVGDATGLRGSTTAGSFYIGLHTADPGEAGTITPVSAAPAGTITDIPVPPGQILPLAQAA